MTVVDLAAAERVGPAPDARSSGRTVERVAMLSVHTSPLAQPGTGDGGGLNVSLLQQARRLAERGVHVDVFTRDDGGVAPTVRVADGLEVHHLAAGRGQRLHKGDLVSHLCEFLLDLERHPTAGTHDVLHAHYWLAGWVARREAARTGIPFAQTFHTYGALKNAALAPGDVPEPPLRLVAERRIAASADRVLGLTCDEARLLHDHFGVPGSRVDIVPAGVDLDVFHPVGDGDATARGRLLDVVGRDAADVLLFAGRLQPLKGPDVAVRVLAEVVRERPATHLVLVGGTSGTGRGRTAPEDLRRLAADLGVADRLHLLPAQPQPALAELYRGADLVLVPSRTETFGLVALEAQACGTPVVAADVGGLRAAVQDGGVRVPGHDPAEHAAAVLDLLGDPPRRARLAEAAAAAGRAHSWDAAVDRLLQVYASMSDASALRSAS